MKLSPGRLQVVLAERDAARAERDAANIALAVQVSKDKELEQRLDLDAGLVVDGARATEKQGTRVRGVAAWGVEQE